MDRTLIRCYHSRPEWTGERWQFRSTPHSPKLQHYWNLTVSFFSVIYRTLIEGVLPFSREAVGVFYSPSWPGNMYKKDLALNNLQWLICHKTNPNWTYSWEGCKQVHTILTCISPKVKAIAALKFELANYNVKVQHINHCTIRFAKKKTHRSI